MCAMIDLLGQSTFSIDYRDLNIRSVFLEET